MKFKLPEQAFLNWVDNKKHINTDMNTLRLIFEMQHSPINLFEYEIIHNGYTTYRDEYSYYNYPKRVLNISLKQPFKFIMTYMIELIIPKIENIPINNKLHIYEDGYKCIDGFRVNSTYTDILKEDILVNFMKIKKNN